MDKEKTFSFKEMPYEEKLELAADVFDPYVLDSLSDIFKKGFRMGANWLMRQSLKDRLSTEEKDSITKLYQQYSDIVKKIIDANINRDEDEFMDEYTKQVLEVNREGQKLLTHLFGDIIFTKD